MIASFSVSGPRGLCNRPRLAAASLAIAAGVGVAVLAPPAQAVAKPITYLETTCAIKSAVPNGGLHGDGCLTWGIPRTVTIGAPKSSSLPPEILRPIIACVQNGLVELVKAWTEIDKTIPPHYKKAASGAYFAMGCVQGIGEAMAELGIH